MIFLIFSKISYFPTLLYRFHAPGLQLDNEVSQSTDHPHGAMEPSGTITTVTGPVGESLYKRTLKTHLFSNARRH